MAYILSNKCAKNCCKRTILVQVIIEDVVTCFCEHSVYTVQFYPVIGRNFRGGGRDGQWLCDQGIKFVEWQHPAIRCRARYYTWQCDVVTSPLPKQTNLASEKEADGDSRVDVSSADVCNRPDDRRDAETEPERNLDDVGRQLRVELGARAARDQHQQERAEKLGE